MLVKMMENKKQNLVEWIVETGLTVEYFACKLKIDKSYVYKLAKGHFIPSDSLMKKITRATLGKFTNYKELIGEKLDI